MPPSESSILSNFLLPPAPLSAAISYEKFKEIVGPFIQDESAIRSLYRELQHSRAMQTDEVKRNIVQETKRGESLKRQVARARRQAEGELMEGIESQDISMEEEMFGPSGNASKPEEHTIETLTAGLTSAGDDLEQQIAKLQDETAQLLAKLRTRVEELSDLRYGTFNKPAGSETDLGADVVSSLEQLRLACEQLETKSAPG